MTISFNSCEFAEKALLAIFSTMGMPAVKVSCDFTTPLMEDAKFQALFRLVTQFTEVTYEVSNGVVSRSTIRNVRDVLRKAIPVTSVLTRLRLQAPC